MLLCYPTVFKSFILILSKKIFVVILFYIFILFILFLYFLRNVGNQIM